MAHVLNLQTIAPSEEVPMAAEHPSTLSNTNCCGCSNLTFVVCG